MAKTGAQRTQTYLVRKRKAARAAGLCIVCCKNQPNLGRITCLQCNTANVERKRRKRIRDHEAAKLHQRVVLQERAGDEASAYHLYADAIHYYGEALNISALSLTNRERITEKIGRASFLNGNFKPASLWFERLISLYDENPALIGKRSIEMLDFMREIRVLECRATADLAARRHSVQMAKRNGDGGLIKLAQLQLADELSWQCRSDEALKILQDICISTQDSADIQAHYFKAYALAFGRNGQVQKCFQSFESALRLAKNSANPFLVTELWLGWGASAWELGETIRAKACYEQALFVVQQYRAPWWIAGCRFYYIRLLTRMGQTAVALSHLREAIATNPSIPFLKMWCAIVGIPLALATNDQAALAACAKPEAIELAFQTDVPHVIGDVSSAFAKLYALRGRREAAAALLHRAFQKVSDARWNLDLLLAIGEHGALTDIPHARAILHKAISLPESRQFQAGLDLFEAFVEQRNGSLDKARIRAQKAAERFEALQWFGYAEEARRLVPGTIHEVRHRSVDAVPFSHMPILTAREREVAALVLQGYTNREIASELFIALHTVEKHMNAIMRRLGVRSRYQVADLLESSSERA